MEKTAKATLGNFRQAPRKMRMVANAVRGKKVSDVLINLDFTAKKASLPIKNLILSALANAKNLDIPTENLVVKTIKVDSGKILYRRRPAARGSAHPIRKRTSAIFVELGEASASAKATARQGKEKKIDLSPVVKIKAPKVIKSKIKVVKAKNI